MIHRLKPAALAIGIAGLALSPAAHAGGPQGTWSMQDGKVTVRVQDCGGNLCARIVGLKEPVSRIDGKPKVDRENPDPAMRSRPLIGLSLLIGMKPAGENAWKGAIYNPDDGRTYAATVRYDGSVMKVKGCVAGVLCKTNNFVRID